MIDINKKYRTRDGKDVRILCNDREGSGCLTVIALVDNSLREYTSTGSYFIDIHDHPLDLIEVSPYDHIKKGDVVLVWDKSHKDKTLALFCGIKEDGSIVATYDPDDLDKKIEDSVSWDFCELYQPKE